MSNLVLKQTAIQQNFSLDALKKKKVEKKAFSETLLIVDASGSMAETIEGGKSKWYHVIDCLKDYLSAKKIYFNDSVYEQRPERPDGGTDLESAFCAVKDNFKKIILISDGLPNSPKDAINSALLLSKPINVIYIGDNNTGEEFMKYLARITRGSQVTVSEKSDNFQQQLASQLKLLT